MKIKVKDIDYGEAAKIKRPKHKKPLRPSIFFRALMKTVSLPDLIKTHYKNEPIGMEKLKKGEPALFLMNHSSFIDLEIVSSLLFPRPFNIVATGDGFVGKSWLMRHIGCIPTSKFVADTTLVRDIIYAVKTLGDSVVMFPEAGYSFDGKATLIPDTVGKLVKLLGIPVVMIRTFGAFARDPLYNNLQLRRVNVTSTESYLLSPEQINSLTADQISDILREQFSFDQFAWQKQNNIRISEPFRADRLNRVLYKCPHCMTEGRTRGNGEYIKCLECGKEYFLDEYGYLRATDGNGKFDHVPDWYGWERECVRAELESGKYTMDVPVEIYMLTDSRALYHVGDGRLTHSVSGFVLNGCNGRLHYEQKPLFSYSLNSDFNWYELGDVISIGNNECLYYCFPKTENDCVAKARLATEELYKIVSKVKQPI